MLLRSLQTRVPEEAWARSHAALLELDANGRISANDLNGVLTIHCQGMKVIKDTLQWAEDNRYLHKFWEEIPTEYALTDIGRAWKQK